MPFPVAARYFLDFRNSDTGLTPTFVFFQRADTFGATSPASPVGGIIEKSNGRYYFDWTWAAKTDPDIVFEVDGGASIPTEEVRYIKGTLSPRDRFLDEPISQVVTDVWADNTAYAAGQKGKRVDDIGAPADTSAAATVFGKTLLYKESVKGADDRSLTDVAGAGFSTGTDSLKVVSDTLDLVKAKTDNLPPDPADASDVALAISNATTSIKGADNRDLTQLAGTGVFVPGTDNLHEIAIDAAAASGAPSASAIAGAVWDEVLASHLTAGSTGAKLNAGLSASQTAAAVWDALTASYAVANSFGAMMSKTSTDLVRVLGMSHENSVLDQTTYTVDNNLLSGRMRIYDSKANADAAQAASPGIYDTGKIAEYAIIATYTGTNLVTYKVSREA